MMKDPRAKSKLRDFLHHWLHVEEGAEIAKDQKEYPGFDQGVVMDLRTSLDLFAESVVWSEASDYRQLLLSDTILMNERLAKFYGQKVEAGDVIARIPREAAKTLPASRNVVFRAQGHGVVVQDACAARLRDAFIEDPNPKRALPCWADTPPNFTAAYERARNLP